MQTENLTERMARIMKKLVSFALLLASFIAILMQPTVETPAAASHSIPVWSVLCYLAVVATAALFVVRANREGKVEAQPEMA